MSLYNNFSEESNLPIIKSEKRNLRVPIDKRILETVDQNFRLRQYIFLISQILKFNSINTTLSNCLINKTILVKMLQIIR